MPFEINIVNEKFYKIMPYRYAMQLKDKFFNNKALWYNVISPQDRAEELYIETEGDYSKIWHEHCNVCWNSIDKNTQTECYVTEDKLVWLCGKCYDILKHK